MGKKNPWRFNITLDPSNPLYKKVAEAINAQPRSNRTSFIVESIVIASQTQVSMQDWFNMQSEFMSRSTCPEIAFTAADIPPKREYKSNTEQPPANKTPSHLCATETESEPANKDLKISFNFDEDADDAELDEFLDNMKIFGGDG